MSMPCDCGRTEKESPPEKKLKLEAEGDGSDLKVEDGDQNGNEESSGYDSDDWTTWPNKDAFIKYFQQVNESDGFDFDEYPGSSMYTPIRPLLKFEGLPKFADEIKGYASMAIKHYFGDDGKERNVTKIVKINAGGPRDVTYYITFRIDNEGKEETFQAKVGNECLCAVEDQGKCWACWSLVAAEAITILYHIKLKKMKLLSKQHVIDCLLSVFKTPKNIRYHEETGCYTSHYNKYYQFAMNERVYSDASYPYVDKRGNCRNLPNEKKTKIKRFKKVDNLDLDKKRIEELIRKQPISGYVKLVDNFQGHLGKDIYMGKTEEEIHFEKLLKSGNQSSVVRHTVLIVGFGVENGIEYYLIKTSWGVKWG